jgi:demethylmenaquinone methyltransferase/2-methoxy-6-polyprenyl-1,4-benzoquinol methylase
MSNGVKKVFSEVPKTYDLLNHLLTFGRDVKWRAKAAEIAAEGGGTKWIDVCTGTGDMAIALLSLAEESTSVYASDFSEPMMGRAKVKTEAGRLQFVTADLRSLPFQDNFFDLVTISFATRNINTSPEHLKECFSEIYRVLKPGGRFVNLETSQPDSGLVRFFFHLYVRVFVKVLGRLISGSKLAYNYLSYTIPRFYAAETLSDILVKIGFNEVKIHRMFMGVSAVHRALK